MTREGAVEVNAATGKKKRISNRIRDADLATNAAAFFVSSAVFFAALRVFSAAFCAVFAPFFLAAFAYCRLICCFCMKRERGLPAICGLSCKALWYWKSTFALNAAFSAFAAAR